MFFAEKEQLWENFFGAEEAGFRVETKLLNFPQS